MTVEKVLSYAMKKTDDLTEKELLELEYIKNFEMTDPELSEKLSRLLIKELRESEF